MKPFQQKEGNARGFTVAEMMVSVGILALAAGAIVQALNSGVILFTKNTAINVSHQEGRKAVNRLMRDIHAAVSIPQLINHKFEPVDFKVKEANDKPTVTQGVSFQMIGSGPNFVKQDPGNVLMIMIQDYARNPVPGMRLIVPHFDIESDISKVSAAAVANHTNVWMVDAAETKIASKLKDGYYAVTYYTDRVAYLVKDGELHFYKQRFFNGNTTPVWVDQGVVARGITSGKPFSLPLTPDGSSGDNRYVQVTLEATDSKSSNRKYKSTTTLLDTAIPYRSRLAKYQ